MSESARITVCPQGPLLVRGDFEVLDADGNRLDTGGSVALCRCGGSAVKPLCDGTHKRTRFDRPRRSRGGESS
ncbi:MAG: CDGSH iron-sulfur domain-containing protein [Propionibacterium sp.]|nr:CDGSH iron-sulfur domain-containing protein [Propionibacterium sp.]